QRRQRRRGKLQVAALAPRRAPGRGGLHGRLVPLLPGRPDDAACWSRSVRRGVSAARAATVPQRRNVVSKEPVESRLVTGRRADSTCIVREPLNTVMIGVRVGPFGDPYQQAKLGVRAVVWHE